MTSLFYYGKSVKGHRQNNQDAIIAEKIGEETYFFSVADGMGGAAGGEIASNKLIEIAIGDVKAKYQNNDFDHIDHRQFLKEIVRNCQEGIHRLVEEDPSLTGMGSTLVMLLIHEDQVYWSCIGDSRIYRYLDGDFIQITKDHSYIQEYIEEHGNELPENLISQYGHIVTKIIDGSGDEADIYPKENENVCLNEDDAFILCSDGLVINRLDNANYLKHIFFQSDHLDDCADRMINYAMNNGSTDNISVILITSSNRIQTERIDYNTLELTDDELNNRDKIKENKKYGSIKLYISIALCLLLICLLIVFYIWMKNIIVFRYIYSF
jgi:PPM family protein phosphatase